MVTNEERKRITNLLTSPASAHEPKIVEFCHLVSHHRCAVSQLAAEVFVVTGPDRHHRPVTDVTKGDYLESTR